MRLKIGVSPCFNFPIGNENGRKAPRASRKLDLTTDNALQRLVQGVIDRQPTAGCWSGQSNDEGLDPDSEVRGSLSELFRAGQIRFVTWRPGSL